MPDPTLLTTKQAAAYLGLSTYALKKHCERGTITFNKIGWRRLFSEQDLKLFRDSHRSVGRPRLISKTTID